MARRARQREASLPGIPGLEDGAVVTGVRVLAGGERCSILVDRRKVGVIPLTAAREIGISPGSAWTPELAARVEAAGNAERARAAAARIIERRAVSARELTDKLVRDGHDRSVARSTAEHMRTLGLVNDRERAASIARSTLARAPAGRRLLESRIRSKGIDAETAGEAVRAALSGREQREDALALARRRVRTLPARLDAQGAMRRVFGALARRGFDADVSRDAARRALQEAGRGTGDGGDDM